METTKNENQLTERMLWFAFKLVSLNHWKQHVLRLVSRNIVVICFQISIFEPLETTPVWQDPAELWLWFAFKLVSLNHWKQLLKVAAYLLHVVICFQISIFEPLETTDTVGIPRWYQLWFAFKLVSLNHWKQLNKMNELNQLVVICFQISIFEPLETTRVTAHDKFAKLWFAFKLVSLNHWKQRIDCNDRRHRGCDLLSN